MANIEEFKSFVKKNPSLITYVKNNNYTWQKIYEIYDLYGENEEVWSKYLVSDNTLSNSNNNKNINSLNNLINMAKNIDVDKVQSGITSLQKALGLFSELFVSKDTTSGSSYQPRAIYKRFED